MRIETLKLHNFRNYQEADIRFFDGIHVIYGENGAGKTSVLEAIHYLSLTKSFRTNTDKHLVRSQEELFRITGNFANGAGQRFETSLAYSPAEGKRLIYNGQRAQKFSEYIGDVPVVLLHPADLSLSQGGPQQRRRFLDVLLSQSSRLYLHHLIQYNRSLRQRNQLLQSDQRDRQLLLSWEEQLITHGSEIIHRRREAAKELSDMVKTYYQRLSDVDEKTKMIYKTNIRPQEDEEISAAYRRAFAGQRDRELEQQTTLVGPHRDELLLLKGGKPMKAYASQGEHKTFVIALKLAEYQYLRHQQNQAPILLFDDIFGELDAGRIRLMLGQLSDIGQVFVTTTSRTFFDKVEAFETPVNYYQVTQGMIEHREADGGR